MTTFKSILCFRGEGHEGAPTSIPDELSDDDVLAFYPRHSSIRVEPRQYYETPRPWPIRYDDHDKYINEVPLKFKEIDIPIAQYAKSHGDARAVFIRIAVVAQDYEGENHIALCVLDPDVAKGVWAFPERLMTKPEGGKVVDKDSEEWYSKDTMLDCANKMLKRFTGMTMSGLIKVVETSGKDLVPPPVGVNVNLDGGSTAAITFIVTAGQSRSRRGKCYKACSAQTA